MRNLQQHTWAITAHQTCISQHDNANETIEIQLNNKWETHYTDSRYMQYLHPSHTGIHLTHWNTPHTQEPPDTLSDSPCSRSLFSPEQSSMSRSNILTSLSLYFKLHTQTFIHTHLVCAWHHSLFAAFYLLCTHSAARSVGVEDNFLMLPGVLLIQKWSAITSLTLLAFIQG